MKEEVSIRLISHTSELPDMTSKNFFHSVEFFRILEATPMQEPCMAVAMDKHGHVLAHMLTTIFFHHSIFPPVIYSHGRVYGEGEYASPSDRDTIFPRFLEAVTTRFNHHLCLYIEFSHLSNKMFGYKEFRRQGYFPVLWQEIHNSLHSMPPADRLSDKTLKKINDARRRGATSAIINGNSNDLQGAVKLLKSYFKLKVRRSIPDIEMFRQLARSPHCRIYATKFHDHIIGVCICIFTEGNAYMWHLASMRKTYMPLHPATFTVWTALEEAHKEDIRHMYFMDAGLPFRRSPMRDFILSFGGMPVSKYRWFKFPIPFVSRMFDWLYNE